MSLNTLLLQRRVDSNVRLTASIENSVVSTAMLALFSVVVLLTTFILMS
ncbi:MAG: hypothetical protein HOE14_13610 [Gemmatimonadales bacterium]|nr:hypothetical protein [Gemmatimonadales bacterium]